ncbi:hypothetical protein SO802_009849 [Lithocarpus litseifolius]|uniref:Uncharacterized protein n=1 Tax=Lithocarpus litseifolius TaxID=425828 RepID=A0AAW2DCM6_9ROSI
MELVDSPIKIEIFKSKYQIPREVGLRYCHPDQIDLDRREGEVVIPMIAFIEGGMTLPMGRITRDYLFHHRLCPQQCAPNVFRILGSIDALNRHLGLGLTWYDVVHLYEGYSQTDGGYYLKSRSPVIRLISCLPRSNKNMKDDYLIASGAWHDGVHCPVKEGDPGGKPLNKNIVTPRLSHTNVPALNFMLWAESFVNEEGQLCAVHKILDFEPISRSFQEIGNSIRAGDSWINRIDVSKPNFLAPRDLPPVVLPIP